jgi:hypothetical protein
MFAKAGLSSKIRGLKKFNPPLMESGTNEIKMKDIQ